MKQLKKGAAYFAALLFWGFLWQIAATKINISFILPSPIQTLCRLWELAMTRDFYITVGTSLLRVAAGFFGGVIGGAILGFLTFRSSWLDALIAPVMVVARATPVASFILVVLLWIGRDWVPGFISFLMVLPIVWQNTVLGFEKRDPRLSEVAKVFGFSRRKTFFRLDLPQVFPFVISSSKTGLGLAWKSGIAAEVLALPDASIGMMIYHAKMYLETVDLYAWTLAIILFSVILEWGLIRLLDRRKGGRNASHS